MKRDPSTAASTKAAGPTPWGLFWTLEEKDFYDIFARAQAFPGPLALSSALLVSTRLCGFKGAIAAFFGVVIPPFVALILVSGLVSTYGSLPAFKRFLDGAGAVVPGIVAAMLWKTADKRSWTPARIFETLVLALVLVLLPRYSLPLLLLGIASFYAAESLCVRSK
ncbi:MAG: chromate transporter [Spirochaetes bacterium]|nr:chromate transporter [Spirochaetota bacterium]